MARIHDGLMMLLMVGRNHVLSLVVLLLRCISVHCDVASVLFWFRWIDVPRSLLFMHLIVHSSIYVDLVLPGVEVLFSD